MSPNRIFWFQISYYTVFRWGCPRTLLPTVGRLLCHHSEGNEGFVFSWMSCLLSVDQKTPYHDTGMAVLSWFTDEEKGSEGDGTWPKSYSQKVAELGFHPTRDRSIEGQEVLL